MPTTPIYGLPYPGRTDSPNGRTQIRALAAAVEQVIAGYLVGGYVSKSSDTSRASTTTVSADPHLTLVLPAGGTYKITAVLGVYGDGGDIKYNWLGTNVTSSLRTCEGPAASTSNNNDTTVRRTVNGLTTEVPMGTIASGSGAAGVIVDQVMVVTSAVDGSLTLRWAQNSSSANATSVLSGSYVISRRVA